MLWLTMMGWQLSLDGTKPKKKEQLAQNILKSGERTDHKSGSILRFLSRDLSRWVL